MGPMVVSVSMALIFLGLDKEGAALDENLRSLISGKNFI